jgi:hypothetical protein
VYQNSRVMGPAYQASTPTPAARPLSTTVPGRVSTRSSRTPAGSSGSGTWKVNWDESRSCWAGSRGPRSPSRISVGVKVTSPSRAPQPAGDHRVQRLAEQLEPGPDLDPVLADGQGPALEAVGQQPVDLGLGQLDGPVGPVDGDPARLAQHHLPRHPDAVQGQLELGGVDAPGGGVGGGQIDGREPAGGQMGQERDVADLHHGPRAQVVLALQGLGDPVLEDPGGGEVGHRAQQDQDHDGDQQLAHQAPPENGGSRASSAPSGTGADGSRQRWPSTSTLE